MNIRKVVIIFLLPFVMLGIFYPGVLSNTFLYFFNGSSIKVKNYTINFPLSHWAYFGKNGASYIISGRKINGKTLKLEISQYSDIDVKKIFSGCDNLEQVTKNYNHLEGIQYICHYGTKVMMYFIPDTKDLIINSSDDFSKNKKELREYDLLFNNITRFSGSTLHVVAYISPKYT